MLQDKSVNAVTCWVTHDISHEDVADPLRTPFFEQCWRAHSVKFASYKPLTVNNQSMRILSADDRIWAATVFPD